MVRVMTATLAGVLILAFSAWLWSQLEGAAPKIIPVASEVLTLTSAEGQVQPGQMVSLRGEPIIPGQPGPEIGKAVVVESAPMSSGGDRLTIKDPTFAAPESDMSQVRSVLPAEGSTGTLRGQVVGTMVKRLFEPLYLQAGGVGLVMAIGAFLTYMYVGSKPSSCEFLIATDGEMKKVNWSTKKNIIDSTVVVVLWSVLLAIGLFSVDFLFAQFFKLIGVLQH